VIDIFDLVKEKVATYKMWLIVGSIFLVACVMIVLLKQSKAPHIPVAYTTSDAISSASSTTQPDSSTSSSAIMIDIKGAIKNPGVYDITNEPRTQTVIAKAGGLTNEADAMQINLAQKLTDGQMIYIPVKGEIDSANHSETQKSEVEAKNDKVNLNTATSEELQTLDGVGEKKADQIIAYREAHGGFKKVDELKEVSGIGTKRFDALKDNIIV